MKIVNFILNALVGWIAGILVTLGLCFLWLKIYPLIDRLGQGAGLPVALFFILMVISPPALIGGLVGGRIPKEGGRRDQIIYAAFFGLIFALPFACFTIWSTGF